MTWPRSTAARFEQHLAGRLRRRRAATGLPQGQLQTMLDTLHEVLSSTTPTPELLLTDDLARRHTSPLVVLVSNNEYALDQPLAQIRPRLDNGRLGIIVLDRPGASAPRSLRGARPQSRSRPPRPYRRPRRRGRHPAAAAPLHNPSRRAARPHLTPPPGRLALGPALITITAPTTS